MCRSFGTRPRCGCRGWGWEARVPRSRIGGGLPLPPATKYPPTPRPPLQARDAPWRHADDRPLTENEPLPAGLDADGWCVYLPRSTRLCYVKAGSARDLVDAVLPAFARAGGGAGSDAAATALRRDALVLNAATHYTNASLYRERLQALVAGVRASLAALPADLVWRDASPQHYGTPDGQWLPRVPTQCSPLPVRLADDGSDTLVVAEGAPVDPSPADPSVGPAAAPRRDAASLLAGGWRNIVADAVLAPLFAEGSLAPLRTWNASAEPHPNVAALYHTFHRPGHAFVDCTHPCQPSTYQGWVAGLVGLLAAAARGRAVGGG